MAKLTDEQKAFIVVSFARYATRPDIRRALAEQWNLGDIKGNHLDCYDPTSWRNRSNPANFRKWQKLFDDTRAELKRNVSQIPCANPEYRLLILGEMIEDAKAKKNYRLVAELLEQAAKEQGGVFTNTREVKAKVDHSHRVDETTEEERKAILADKIREALGATGQPTTH